MMISSIGNRKKRFPASGGFTFIEIMVTIMILSTGIVTIYQAYLLSLDRQEYLLHRLYANNVLDLKIAEMEGLFREKGKAALNEQDMSENIVINHKSLACVVKVFYQEILELDNVLQMDIGIAWTEGERTARLTRSVYLIR